MKARDWLLPLALAAAMLAAFAAGGCGGGRPAVTVFAAASLTDALQPLGAAYADEHGVDLRFSFGGSWALAQQIARGAPADAFVAAGDGPMDALVADGLVAPADRRVLLGNSLVLVARAGAAAPSTPEGLLSDSVGRVATADPQLAPAGAYARLALESLGLWTALQPKLVYGPDVRTALQYAAGGDADAAVVYATDAASTPGVRVLYRFPPTSHPPIRYPAAVVAGAAHADAAAAFLTYLAGDDAQAALQSHGFAPPP